MTIEKIFTPQDDAFYAVITHAAGRRRAAADPADADGISQRQSVRHDPERRMGWDANKLTGKEVLIIGTGRHPRRGRTTGCAGLPHRAREIGMQMQAAAKRSPATAGSRLRPSSAIRATGARRARTGCSTPAVPQRCGDCVSSSDSLPADAPGGHWRGDLR